MGEGWPHLGLPSGTAKDKPASWLTLSGSHADAFLKVWSSGEAELEWGVEGDAHARHYDLSSVETLRLCVDDLEAALRAFL